jgi:hypothetical protein
MTNHHAMALQEEPGRSAVGFATRVPARAIHFSCHPTVLGWRGLEPIAERPGIFVSKCWIIRRGDPWSLNGGWLYLHESSYKASGFGARIREVEPCCTETGRPGFAFTVERIRRATERWRGSTPSQSRHHGGLVPADSPSELEHE